VKRCRVKGLGEWGLQEIDDEITTEEISQEKLNVRLL